MRIWEELTLEQYAVIVVARESGHLDDLPDEYGKRLRWAMTGDTRHVLALPEDGRERLVGRLAGAVVDLAERGWVEARSTMSARWQDTSAMSEDDLAVALARPGCWNRPPDGRRRGLTLVTTDRWRAFSRAVRC